MHSLVKSSLIKWLKKARFRCIRTEQQLIVNKTIFRPDVYAEKYGEKFIFDIVVSHFDFCRYLPLTEYGFRLFIVMPHEDYIANERINLYEIKKPISIVVDMHSTYLSPLRTVAR
jgi:hypothetical protein